MWQNLDVRETLSVGMPVSGHHATVVTASPHPRGVGGRHDRRRHRHRNKNKTHGHHHKQAPVADSGSDSESSTTSGSGSDSDREQVDGKHCATVGGGYVVNAHVLPARVPHGAPSPFGVPDMFTGLLDSLWQMVSKVHAPLLMDRNSVTGGDISVLARNDAMGSKRWKSIGSPYGAPGKHECGNFYVDFDVTAGSDVERTKDGCYKLALPKAAVAQFLSWCGVDSTQHRHVVPLFITLEDWDTRGVSADVTDIQLVSKNANHAEVPWVSCNAISTDEAAMHPALRLFHGTVKTDANKCVYTAPWQVVDADWRALAPFTEAELKTQLDKYTAATAATTGYNDLVAIHLTQGQQYVQDALSWIGLSHLEEAWQGYQTAVPTTVYGGSNHYVKAADGGTTVYVPAHFLDTLIRTQMSAGEYELRCMNVGGLELHWKGPRDGFKIRFGVKGYRLARNRPI